MVLWFSQLRSLSFSQHVIFHKIVDNLIFLLYSAGRVTKIVDNRLIYFYSSQVMFLCFFLCTITYVSIAICGYLMFGSKLESQITLNLPINKVSSKIAVYTTLVNPIAKYALILTPVIHTIENRFQSYCKGRSYTIFIRTSLLISTVAVALTIPFFGLLMSLIGAFLSITASILLPCLCYLKISGAYQRFGLEMLIIGCILVFGIAVLVIGTYTSLVEIIGQL